MSKRPTVVKPASEGSKKIVMKHWNAENSNPNKYEIDSIEQVMPNGAMLMAFEEERTDMEKKIGKSNLETKNLWISPPPDNFDKIINNGVSNNLSEFNAFFTEDVHIAIKDGYHPYRVILCRVQLGREGREYEKKYGKVYLKRVVAIPSFIVTFTIRLEEVSHRASEKQRDEVYDSLVNKGEFKVSKENLVVDVEDEPQTIQHVEGQKFCEDCGELNNSSAKFCSNCGYHF
ncbi:Zinc-ribbon domain-containing protein [Entamoeba marina]